ncbi:MAG: HAD-IIA family hydrolase [Aerococcus sp.]|nr:HAD-IIA family hydrolase [Aerococcus sp.]
MKGLLIDLDGTIYRGSEQIEGAKDFIRTLQEKSIPFLFVTNNATRAPEVVAESLAKQHDITVPPQHIYTSVDATVYALQQLQMEKHWTDITAFVIGSPYLHDTLTRENVTIHRTTTDNTEQVVVVGLDFEVTYHTLSEAGLALQAGAEFLLTNPDLQLPSERGYLPGNGTLGNLLQSQSGVAYEVCGKPAVNFMTGALARLGLKPSEAVVVGDNLYTDIQAAINANMASLLMETGVHTRYDADQLAIHPTTIFPDYHTLLAEGWLDQA